MKIGVVGSDGNILCQLNAVRNGLEALGHECTTDIFDPDVAFVFVGNPPFEKYIPYIDQKKFIFNVLDLAPHCKEHRDIVNSLSIQLPLASRVTTISESVQKQLKELCHVTAEVIYYPMKPIYEKKHKAPRFRAMMVGRTSDPNKRCSSAVVSLVKAGYDEDEVAIVGPEYPGWGYRCGIISDDILNSLYNTVDYVLMFSKEEGIGLPAIEAACAGAIPIILPDLSTYDDFWDKSPMGIYYQTFTSIDKVSQFIIYMDSNPEEKNIMKDAMKSYADIYFRPKFDNVEVAKKIIQVFQSI